MRALAIFSVLGLLLGGLAVPEHSNLAFEVVRIFWSDFSPEPRSDKRVHLGESHAKSIEIYGPSGRVQNPENISCNQVLQIDEPARGAARR